MKTIILTAVIVAAGELCRVAMCQVNAYITVSALSDLQEFRRIMNKSRLECRRNRGSKAPINRELFTSSLLFTIYF